MKSCVSDVVIERITPFVSYSTHFNNLVRTSVKVVVIHMGHIF